MGMIKLHHGIEKYKSIWRTFKRHAVKSVSFCSYSDIVSIPRADHLTGCRLAPHKDTLTSSWLLRSSSSKDQKKRLLIIWGSKWRDPLDQLLSHFFFFTAVNSIKYILYEHTHKYLWLNQKSHKTILPFIIDGPWHFSSSSFCSIAGGRGRGEKWWLWLEVC